MAFVDGVAPGITFNEVEEQGTNVVEVSNAAAIVGEATKGPIGVATLCNSVAKLKNIFGNVPSVQSALQGAVECLKTNGEVWYVRIASSDALEASGKTDSNNLKFSSLTKSAELNGAKVIITKVGTNLVNYALVDTDGNTLESFDDLSLDSNNKMFIGVVLRRFSEYLGCTYTLSGNVINLTSDFGEDNSTIEITLANGNSGLTGIEDEDVVAGINALGNPEEVDFATLVVPYKTSQAVYNAALALCESRKDIVYIPSIPNGLTAQNLKHYVSAFGSYSGSGKQFDSDAVFWVAPNGIKIDENTGETLIVDIAPYIAATFNYSDNLAGSAIWFAPAGVTRGLVQNLDGLERTFTKEERDTLYGAKYNVNTVVNVRGHGIRLMGAHTSRIFTAVDTNTSLRYINVRRLCNYIRKFVIQDSLLNLFDNNDRYTWDAWKLRIDPKLRAIKDGRGVYDYVLKMDEDTVTQQDIDEGRMPGLIKIAPEKPAEYIEVNFVIAKNGTVTFTENVEED